VIEGQPVEALPDQERVGREVAAAAEERDPVTARAAVGVHRRQPVEVAREDERRARVGDRITRPLRARAAGAVLRGDDRIEQAAPVAKELRQGDVELVPVGQVLRDPELLAQG